MYHQLGKIKNFTLPYSIFNNNYPNMLFSSHGNYFLDKTVGPDSGYAIGMNKKDTILRAFAEAIERRGSMLGGKIQPENGMVQTWDLKKNEPSYLDPKYTTFKPKEIDTTGCAVHTDSDKAIINALKEIYEKNSLYLFWYGKDGLRIDLDFYKNNAYYRCLISSGFKVSLFVNDFFKPLKIVISLIYRNDEIILCGIGSSMSYGSAINHALEEAFLIGAFNYYYILNGNEQSDILLLTPRKMQHIKDLEKLPLANLNLREKPEISVRDLTNICPDFSSGIHVIFIDQKIIPNLKCVKIYVEGLFNCLPLKKNVLVNNKMNRSTLELDEAIINELPECPMS